MDIETRRIQERRKGYVRKKKVRFHLQDEAPRVRMADKHAKEHELKHSRADAIQCSL